MMPWSGPFTALPFRDPTPPEPRPACPKCDEPVPAGLDDCPNCGAWVVVGWSAEDEAEAAAALAADIAEWEQLERQP